MEGDVCVHSKFGYCKYKSNCKKIHFAQICEDFDKCKNIQTCKLRHPKRCKKFADGCCRFADTCEYHHQDQIKSNEYLKCKDTMAKLNKKGETMALKNFDLETELKDVKGKQKLKEKETPPEKVMKALSRKVLILESEMEGIKKKYTERENKNEERLEIYDKNSFNPTSCSSPKEKITGSKPNVLKDKVKTNKIKEGLFNCNICDYKVQKEETLKKHMVIQHEDHTCKECKHKLPSFMELLKRIAEKHAKDRGEEKGEKAKDKENITFMSSESMVDEVQCK